MAEENLEKLQLGLKCPITPNKVCKIAEHIMEKEGRKVVKARKRILFAHDCVYASQNLVEN